jgi:hypothetical protein
MTVVGAVGLSTRHRRRRPPAARIFLSEIQNLCYPANHGRNAKSSRILPPGPRGKVRARPEPKNFGDELFGFWVYCNPLKLHKTAKGIFGKAWRKRAEIWKSLQKSLESRLYFATSPLCPALDTQMRRSARGKGNFPLRKPLIIRETWKESRSALQFRERARNPELANLRQVRGDLRARLFTSARPA